MWLYAGVVAVLRLFAGAREAAGAARVELDGDDVAAVLDAAVGRFGERFAAVLATSKVWVNGEPADRSHPVSPRDEVAVPPPVSGGAVSA